MSKPPTALTFRTPLQPPHSPAEALHRLDQLAPAQHGRTKLPNYNQLYPIIKCMKAGPPATTTMVETFWTSLEHFGTSIVQPYEDL